MTTEDAADDTVLDMTLKALRTRPDRISWVRPRIMLPVFQECATSLRAAGYSVTTGVRGDNAAFLTGRLHPVPVPVPAQRQSGAVS